MIRRAAAADADVLTAIGHAAKRHWNYPEAWIALWRRDLTVSPEFIDRYPVHVALADEAPVAFYALLFAGADCELEHFWVLPAWMGRGLGRRLFEHALACCRAIGVGRLWINADPNAEGFYRRMGARRVGEVPSTPAGRTLPRLERLTA